MLGVTSKITWIGWDKLCKIKEEGEWKLKT